MSNITILDIMEALAAPSRTSPKLQFSPGDVVAAVAWVPSIGLEAVPPILRTQTGSIIIPMFRAGTTRDEVKAMLCQVVDGIFDSVGSKSTP